MTGFPAEHRTGQFLGLRPAKAGFTAIDRFVYLFIALGSTFSMLLGRYLTPSATGVGTHEQLGLPACPTLHLTGYPCPSCGLTTSFALAARMEFTEALQVQPFGLIIFFLAIVLIPGSVYLLARRKPVIDLIVSRRSNLIMYILLALYLGGWAYKIFVMSF